MSQLVPWSGSTSSSGPEMFLNLCSTMKCRSALGGAGGGRAWGGGRRRGGARGAPASRRRRRACRTPHNCTHAPRPPARLTGHRRVSTAVTVGPWLSPQNKAGSLLVEVVEEDARHLHRLPGEQGGLEPRLVGRVHGCLPQRLPPADRPRLDNPPLFAYQDS